MINVHKIKTRIYELQLSQEEIAKNMELDISTLNAKINNKRRIYIDEVVKLCEILQIGTSTDLKEYFGMNFLLDNKCEKAQTNDTEGA